jgi:hypothetical protein
VSKEKAPNELQGAIGIIAETIRIVVAYRLFVTSVGARDIMLLYAQNK